MTDVEALATALHDTLPRSEGHLHDDATCRSLDPDTGVDYHRAQVILAALPPGVVIVSVEDVARRLHGGSYTHPLCNGRDVTMQVCDGCRIEARRLLGREAPE